MKFSQQLAIVAGCAQGAQEDLPWQSFWKNKKTANLLFFYNWKPCQGKEDFSRKMPKLMNKCILPFIQKPLVSSALEHLCHFAYTPTSCLWREHSTQSHLCLGTLQILWKSECMVTIIKVDT